MTIARCGMRTIALLLAPALVANEAWAASFSATQPEAFVPGWQVLARATGDLDGDGRPDAALALEEPERESLSPARCLLIALRDRGGRYRLAGRDDRAIMRADEGGMFGDPFEGVSIERGAVVVRHHGGSNWRWVYVDRFALREERWRWIGETCTSYFTGDASSATRDTNLATGDVIVTCSPGAATKQRGRNAFHTLMVTPAERRPAPEAEADWPGPVTRVRLGATRLRLQGRQVGATTYVRVAGTRDLPRLVGLAGKPAPTVRGTWGTGERHVLAFATSDLGPRAGGAAPLDQLPLLAIALGRARVPLAVWRMPRAGWPELGDAPRSEPRQPT
jgi:hypothetical protein